MSQPELKQIVWEANRRLPKMGLVLHTWGNVSQIDRKAGTIAIKPSGVSYEDMQWEDIVLVDLRGSVLEGTMRPSSDLMTHVVLYQAFENIGGIVHTHSTYATAWAQAGREIPCAGTTHADTFYGAIPVTRSMLPKEVAQEYEANTGHVIVERFGAVDADHIPGVLVRDHGPFVWGRDAAEAVYNASVMEEVAHIALLTEHIASGGAQPIGQYLLDRHFLRKHGVDAYYGQGKR